jgi:hypothetical protein
MPARYTLALRVSVVIALCIIVASVNVLAAMKP